MTIDHPIRRTLARVCSGETMARIVDPVLADVRSEQRRPRWLGYFDLLRALAVHTVTSTPRVIARAASDNGYAMPRAAVIAIAGGWHLRCQPPSRENAAATAHK